ncbi:stage III sporulation protein SpoIIIAB [Alkalibacillus sp. S2W]|uniref:Stage III sporulation protein AB n=1 Tax=Alkalibacillus salilacus TaxID=284582 RepID=A0ABT9VCE7_9BACI|nr:MULTISPECIES: stage III sporulation protein SpoIIIAB [Alkalibacillus]MDQ0158597.1 stage III sporulation protein AB [Alkalibacillus salilacus]NIK12420.1 stage III sporulation protein AB [Alkalibacillus almallahensis]
MKWVGAILILLTCTWVGIDFANQYKKRPQQIRDLLQALQIMEAEIVYAQKPIETICRYISKQLSFPIGSLFQRLVNELNETEISLDDCWENVIEEEWHFTALKSKEKQIMLQFGQSLGRHNIEQQRKQIQLARVHLQYELDEALEEEKRFSSMYRVLGVLSGLLFVLILI